MGELLSSVLHSYHQIHGVFILPLAALLTAWNRESILNAAIASRSLSYAAVGIGCAVIASYFFILILGQLSLGYGDHLEAVVTSISWVVLHGQPAYPDWRSGDLYGGIYGPLLFLINGAVLFVSPSIAATKLVAAAALAVGVVGVWLLSNRINKNWQVRLFLAAMLIVELIPYRSTSYWVRAEPFLYLLSVLALIIGVRRRPGLSILLIGFLAGLAADLKIHAVIYLLPIGLMVLRRMTIGRERIVAAIGGALAAVMAFVAPAIVDHSVVRLYTDYLAFAAGHGISGVAIVENIEIGLALATPPIFLFLWRRPRLSGEEIWFAAGLIIAFPITVILGSKNGALPNYLLPLCPSFFYMTAITLAGVPRRNQRENERRGLAAIAFLVVFFCNAGTWLLMLESITNPATGNKILRAKSAELIALVSAHPEAEMGASDDMSYGDTFIEPLQVMQNGLLHFSVPAWMDLREGKMDEEIALHVVEKCVVASWLMPAGQPFSITTPYTGRPLFSDNFRKVFVENYILVDQRQFYGVWTCRTHR